MYTEEQDLWEACQECEGTGEGDKIKECPVCEGTGIYRYDENRYSWE